MSDWLRGPAQKEEEPIPSQQEDWLRAKPVEGLTLEPVKTPEPTGIDWLRKPAEPTTAPTEQLFRELTTQAPTGIGVRPSRVVELISKSPDPKATQDEVENTIMASALFGVSLEQGRAMTEGLAKSLDGENGSQATLRQRFEGGLQIQAIEQQQNELSLQDMAMWASGKWRTPAQLRSEGKEEEAKTVEDRNKRMADLQAKADEINAKAGSASKLNILFGFARTLGDLASAGRQGLLVSLGTTPIGAAAGAAAGGVGALPGAAAGFMAGMTGGAIGYWTRQTMGRKWRELRAADVDGNVAMVLSVVFGGLEASLEFIGTSAVVKAAIPGIDKATRALAETTIQRIVQNPSFKSRIAESAARLGTALLTNTWEEEAQNWTAFAAELAAEVLDAKFGNRVPGGLAEGKPIAPSWQEYLQEQAMTAVVTPIITAMLAGGGTAAEIATAGVQAYKTPKVTPTTTFAEELGTAERGEVVEAIPIPEEPMARLAVAEQLEDPETKAEMVAGEVVEEDITKDLERLDAEIAEILQSVEKLEAERPLTAAEMGIYPEPTAEVERIALEQIVEEMGKPKPTTAEVVEPVSEALKSARQEAALQTLLAKKEAITTERARLKALEQKRKEKLIIREHIRTQGKKIVETVPESVDIIERKKIEAIQDLVDASFRKDTSKLERKRAWFQQHPELMEGLSEKERTRLEKKPLNKWTVAELDDMAERVRQYKEFGKRRRALEKKRESALIESSIQRVVQQIAGKKGLPPLPKGPILPRGTAIKEKARGFNLARFGPEMVTDKLDGGVRYTGPNHELIWDTTQDLYSQEKLNEKAAQKNVLKVVKDLGETMWKLRMKKYEFESGTYNKDMLLSIVAGWENEKFRAALQGEGMQITEEIYKEMKAKLTPEDLRIVNAVIAEYEPQYERMRDTAIRVENKEPPKEDNYTPLVRDREGEEFDDFGAEMDAEIEQRNAIAKAKVDYGGIIERKNIAPEHQGKVKLGLITTFMKRYPQAEHYIQLREQVKRLNRVYGDKRVRQAIEAKYGKAANKWIDEYIKDIANPERVRVVKGANVIDQALHGLRRNMGRAYLSFKILTVLRQPISLAYYTAYAGPHMLSSAYDMITDPAGTWQFARENDGTMAARTWDRWVAEFQSSNPTAYRSIMEKMGESGLAMIWFVDGVTTTLGWKAVYNKNKHLGHDAAVRQARNVTLRSQPVGDALHLPSLFKARNELARMATMFQVQRTAVFNLLTREMPQMLKAGKPMAAMTTLLSIAMGASVMALLSKKRLPRKVGEGLKWVVQQFLGFVPMLGVGASNAMDGLSFGDDISFPPFAAVKAGVKAVDAVASGNLKKFKSGLSDLLFASAVLAGAPAEAGKDILKAVEEGAQGDWEDVANQIIMGGEPAK